MGWVTAHAPTGAELDACVQCGLCLPACPTFRLTGDETASPRGRLLAMSAVASGAMVIDDTFAEIMGFCLQCRACEAACPSLVPFGRTMEGARAEVAAQLPAADRRLRHRVLGTAGLGNRTAVSAMTALAAIGQRVRAPAWLPGRIGRALGGLRPLPLKQESTVGADWPALGPERGVATLFAGCVMDAWFTDVHLAAAALLRRAGYRVVVPRGQTCCGALAAHDGAAGVAEGMAVTNRSVFAGSDLVVVDAAGCSAHLKDLAAADPAFPRVVDVVEAVAAAIDEQVLPRLPSTGVRVAIQDPCHLRHAQRIVDEPRSILQAAGLVPVEIDPDGMCCGAAGVYSVVRPATAAELGRRKAAQVESSGATVIASANPGCEMQLRTHLGAGYRIAHPVELYAEALAGFGRDRPLPSPEGVTTGPPG